MNNSPEKEKAKKTKSFNALMENNKFVFLLSLIIAFGVWVAVAMYKSPQESFTIYNVPIQIDTENSIVSQKGYINVWQSDDKIDVTVNGPRYMINTITADDLIVTANLNSVDSAGISQLNLKVELKKNSEDVTIASMSQTSIEVYFDAELEKEFQIQLDDSAVNEKIAQGYKFKSAELTVSGVTIKGPETEINKIVRVVADPQYPKDLLFETSTVPVTLSLEGETAADTVSVNKYVQIVEGQEYFVKLNIARELELLPVVSFTGTKTGTVETVVDVQMLNAELDTSYEFEENSISVLTVDYASLTAGENKFTVKTENIELPQGITLTDNADTLNIVITLTQ